VAPELQPKHIVVLNLFRDQLDRYGELDTTAALIGQGISATEARLHLNADDPLVVSLAKYARDPSAVSFFGIEGLPASAASAYQAVADSDRCPECHARLKYSRSFFSHIGHYRCPNGDFSRPQPAVAITSAEQHGAKGSSFTFAIGGRRTDVDFPLPGTYNLYNALAAISVVSSFGVSQKTLADVIASAKPAFGRAERVSVHGRELYLLLIKNPAGFSQILDTFLVSEQGVSVLFIINDNDADGRDVSWLWDVPLEVLSRIKPTAIASGIRGSDMRLRLHYAGVGSSFEADIAAALDELIDGTPAGGVAYVLPTYTSMLAVRKALSKLIQMAEF
jgi:UDP-N-acetylmuramyl tripeptide synthase